MGELGCVEEFGRGAGDMSGGRNDMDGMNVSGSGTVWFAVWWMEKGREERGKRGDRGSRTDRVREANRADKRRDEMRRERTVGDPRLESGFGSRKRKRMWKNKQRLH